MKLTQEITALAEEVVLPIHQRTLSRTLSRKVPIPGTPEAETLRNVESDSISDHRFTIVSPRRTYSHASNGSPHNVIELSDATDQSNGQMEQEYYFPAFIILTSVFQVNFK